VVGDLADGAYGLHVAIGCFSGARIADARTRARVDRYPADPLVVDKHRFAKRGPLRRRRRL